jgi:hypothetical protein
MASRISAVVSRSIITGTGCGNVAELPCAASVGLAAASDDRAKATRTRLNFMVGLLLNAGQGVTDERNVRNGWKADIRHPA